MRKIYISGSGRSGSTMVERLLHAGGVGCALGEFHCLWRMPRRDQTCACGNPAADDEFWSAVLQQASLAASDLSELERLERTVVRTGYIARHGFDVARLARQSEVRAFLSLQNQLFAAIVQQSGQDVLIDSSKAGPRAWILACDPDVRFLHLWRDPADVIASWRSRKFDRGLGTEMQRLSITRAALDWIKVEGLMRRLARQVDVASLSYRAICVDPRNELDRALAAIGLPAIEENRWLASHTMMPVSEYHSLNGNPDRFGRDPITVSLRETDWRSLPRTEAWRIRMQAMAMASLYPAPV
ncbi:MAG: sulfotransferase [Novosphingobium sp.]